MRPVHYPLKWLPEYISKLGKNTGNCQLTMGRVFLEKKPSSCR